MDSRPLGSHSLVALIPARAGSKRCHRKNTRLLNGKPLLQWSIESANASRLFSRVIVSTDDPDAMGFATDAGCAVHVRKPEHATDDACDYLWVQDVMRDRQEEIYAILRPTSPFRTASTIKRAYAELIASGADSIRAVEPVKQHPGKMWEWRGRFLQPVLPVSHADGTPWHSSPTQSLPAMYVQNASLEMSWRWVLEQTKTISGYRVAGLLTDTIEGFDINDEGDFTEAEFIAESFTASSG